MITIKWECPKFHEKFTADRQITFEVRDEASLDEMLESYTHFLKATGYHVPEKSCLQFVEDEL
jgi:hypothetical protein